MNKSFLILLFTFLLNTALGQKELMFPPGITIDPTIEEICKPRKDINTFNIVHYINDSINKQPLLNSLNKLPLTSFVAISNKDTLLTFMGLLIPYGIQISLKSSGAEVTTFVSSRSCKCFKNNLSESKPGYGAGATPTSLTLVLNKINNIKIGEKIFGFIRAEGGDIFHFPAATQTYEKWNFTYEGYFAIEFKPVGN